MSTKKTNDQFLVPLEELLEAGCHFGHQARRWFPKMAPYVWAERGKVHIVDLEKTQKHLQQACVFVRDLAAQGKIIVFVGSKRQASPIIKEEAERVGAPYVSNRWLGGTISNWDQIKKSITTLVETQKKLEEGELDHYTKKERVVIDKDLTRLERLVGGLKQLKDLPDALYIVDIKREVAAALEARQAGISIVAIIDTNVNPDMVDWVIPANDDAVRSIRLITSRLADAVAAGKAAYKPPAEPEQQEKSPPPARPNNEPKNQK